MVYPKTQKEFELLFSDEQSCWSYLFDIKFPMGFECNICQSNQYWVLKKKIIRCKKCKKEISLTSGTIFQDSNLKLMDIFRVIWWMVAQKNGISARGIERVLGISYPTAWRWLHKFRRVLVIPQREKLSGTIEVDETFVGGKKKGKRGRGAEGKAIVVIAVEVFTKGTGRVRLAIIEDASRKSLNRFIKDNIEKGSTIISDAWNGYVDLAKMKYKRQVINQSKQSDDENKLPNVHRVASLLKRWLLGTHHNYANKGMLEFYLDEFVFRYNRRNAKSRGLLFYTIVYQALLSEPILMKNIKKSN